MSAQAVPGDPPIDFVAIDLQPLETGIHHGTVAHQDTEFEATVIGTAPAAGTFTGNLEIDQVMGYRTAEDGQADGLHQGSGFTIICATVTTIYDWGSYDLEAGDVHLMIDAEDMPPLAVESGMRVSIAFKEAIITMED